MTLTLTGCPRCGGLVTGDKDSYGTFLHCVNCGWYRDLAVFELKRARRQYPREMYEEAEEPSGRYNYRF